MAQTDRFTISGTVTDKETGEPLPDVNVYLSGTQDGSATDSIGQYRFRTSRTGPHELVASIVGYKSTHQLVTLGSESSYRIDFELEENVFELDEVEVTGSNRQWKSQYSYFETFFLGNDPFSADVIIENPEVLDFRTGSNSAELIATAREALEIRNEALGYRITAELEEARFDVTKNIGYYTIYPVFREMEAPDRRTRRLWERNREKAYRGSARHFFKSLYHDRVKTNSFHFSPSWGLKELNMAESIRVLRSLGADKLKVRYKVFYFETDRIEVGHDMRRDRGGKIINTGELSYLEPDDSGRNYFLINSDGQLYDPQSVIMSGKWAADRLSKLLPHEYSP